MHIKKFLKSFCPWWKVENCYFVKISAVKKSFISYFNEEGVYAYFQPRDLFGIQIIFYNFLKNDALPIDFNAKFNVKLFGNNQNFVKSFGSDFEYQIIFLKNFY